MHLRLTLRSGFADFRPRCSGALRRPAVNLRASGALRDSALLIFSRRVRLDSLCQSARTQAGKRGTLRRARPPDCISCMRRQLVGLEGPDRPRGLLQEHGHGYPPAFHSRHTDSLVARLRRGALDPFSTVRCRLSCPPTAIEHTLNAAHGMRLRQLAFPNSDHRPAASSQHRIDSFISSRIGLHLLSPEGNVGLWYFVAPRAAMPEASIDE
jgi:hypothetical protein